MFFRLLVFPLLMMSPLFADQINLEVESVSNFELDRYLGTWYELTRMDHSFERGMSHVTATYSLDKKGRVEVLNRGYVKKKSNWKEARGHAKLKNSTSTGAFKVTFFWPFYGGYHIVELAEDYTYALVAGDSEKYLWILSRTPQLPEETWAKLLQRARSLGYDTDALIMVDHEPLPENP
ncbi:MAG: lipocalin family protein [Candidatus Marinimicrobia bacterium]|nr:lipocalin family protein [Candidatus Neomarinimicrobiota bacterium]